MKAIVAVNNLGFIGKGNTMLWHCKEDLQHFKNLTEGCKLLVGYNTNLCLPPLKNRELIVDDKIIYHNHGIDWCIGGKKTYEKYSIFFDELHISHIDNDDIGDIVFPDLKNLNPFCKIYNYYFKINNRLPITLA